MAEIPNGHINTIFWINFVNKTWIKLNLLSWSVQFVTSCFIWQLIYSVGAKHPCKACLCSTLNITRVKSNTSHTCVHQLFRKTIKHTTLCVSSSFAQFIHILTIHDNIKNKLSMYSFETLTSLQTFSYRFL